MVDSCFFAFWLINRLLKDSDVFIYITNFVFQQMGYDPLLRHRHCVLGRQNFHYCRVAFCVANCVSFCSICRQLPSVESHRSIYSDHYKTTVVRMRWQSSWYFPVVIYIIEIKCKYQTGTPNFVTSSIVICRS